MIQVPLHPIQNIKLPVDTIGRDMASAFRPRHKASNSISVAESSRSHTPVLNTSASFPSLRSASSLSCLSPQTPTQGKLSGLATATKQRARDVWSRRKPASELDTTMKPLREIEMDSPTIPGRPALNSQQQRDHNFSNNWRQNVFGEAMLSSIEPPPSMTFLTGDITPVDSPSEEKLILPKTNPSPITLDNNDDLPPKVPPKEPVGVQRKRSTSLQKGDPPRATSAMANLKPREITITAKKNAGEGQSRAGTPVERASSPQKSTTAPRAPSPQKATVRPRADTVPTPKSASAVLDGRPKLHLDTKQASAPVSPQTDEEPIKRPRPRRRKSSTHEIPLPQGVRPSEAGIDLSKNELDVLQHAAKIQAENFDVLKPADVSFLQKELVQLESRCQYLKETQKSLRAGRKTLQARMLTYLRSSRSGVFSRESLLKQEEALAELDEAIEDWDLKVEKAEERRLQVSRKLLEHAAAALSVPNDHVLPLRVMTTPPGTPERPKRQRAEVESITVYALLADVEQELGRMLS